MTRPSTDVVRRIDELVAQLDSEMTDEPYVGSATSSYEIIAIAWERFKALIADMNHAVAEPFSAGSATVLRKARHLCGPETYRLAFWLVHVGEARFARVLIALRARGNFCIDLTGNRAALGYPARC